MKTIERFDPQVHEKVPSLKLRMTFGLAGLLIGSAVDKYYEKRLLRKRGFDRRVFLHRVFYGYVGYTFGQVLDNMKLTSQE